MLIENSGNTALDVAAVTSASIVPQKFNNLKTTKDTDGDYYKAMQEKLDFIRRISGAKHLYAMTKNEKGEYVYIIDGSENPAKLGTVEEEYEAYNKVYTGTPYIERTIRETEYGVLVSAYQPIKYNDEVVGFVGIDYSIEEGYKILKNMRFNIIVLSLILSAFALFISFIFSRQISKPLEHLAKNTKKLSEYDLSIDSLKVVSNDEIGALTQGFNLMVKSIKDLIQDTQTSTLTISETSGSILKISDVVNAQTDQILSAIQHVTEDITSQTNDISDGVEKTDQLARSIEAVASAIRNISSIFSELERLNTEGFNWVSNLNEKAEEAHHAFADVGAVVHDVDESSKRIGDILDTVESISNQTNLLALNASIEAARSGEHGRGFAVVAEEIRKLAEESSKSTEEINNYINAIQTRSSKAVKSMESSKAVIQEQNQIIHKTSDVFKQLSNNISALANHISQIERLNKDMNSKKDDIVYMINEIRESSEEVSAVSEQTSAFSEEIMMSISSLNEFANNLADLSKELRYKINKFRT